MTDQPVALPAVDEPPSGGVWTEHDDLELTEDEVADGNHLGATIDAADDTDTGTL